MLDVFKVTHDGQFVDDDEEASLPEHEGSPLAEDAKDGPCGNAMMEGGEPMTSHPGEVLMEEISLEDGQR